MRIVHGFSKLPGLVLLVCSCFPVETQTVVTLIPGSVAMCILGSRSIYIFLGGLPCEEGLAGVAGGCLGKAWGFHFGSRLLKMGSASSWQGGRAVGNPALGQEGGADETLKAAVWRSITSGVSRVKCILLSP